MLIRFTKTELYVSIMCIGLLFFPSILRTRIWDNAVTDINMLAMGALLILQKKACVHKYNRGTFAFFSILLWVSFLLLSMYRRDYLTCALVAATILLPTYFINIRFRDDKVIECTYVWVRTLKICTVIMVSCGLIDYASNHAVSKFFADFYNVISLQRLSAARRMVSYMGHALLSGEVFLITYVTVYLYRFVLKEKQDSLTWFIICFAGCVMTGSKACVVLIVIAFMLFHLSWKKQKYIIIALFALLLVYATGIMDTFLSRFLLSVETNNLTTNRMSALKSLFEAGELNFSWFKGKNIDYGWKMVAALEFPILRWAYQFGIMVSLCLTIIAFVMPVFSMIKLKVPKEFLYGILVIIADVNMYNGLALTRDNMLIYCVSVIFVMNMALLCRRKKE